MEKISAFIAQAREKGLSDESIRKTLEAEGWKKEKIDMALVGLEAPKPDTLDAPLTSSPTPPASTQPFSLSPLMAALHHVILWFFISSSTITIGGTVASLYGMNVSSNVLASMIAVTLITFVPYAVLFGIFLGKTRKNPLLVPGKVWSIITICLHSLGAMTAAIVVVVNLIVGGQQIFLVSGALILALNLLIVITYSFAAFGVHRALNVRKTVILLHLPLLIVMFGVLFSMSLLKLGPAKHDEDLRNDLSALTAKIRSDTRSNNKLPDSINGLTSNKSIRYERLETKKYKLCASFDSTNVSDPTSSYSYYRDLSNDDLTDAYVSESSFYTTMTGENCFTLKSDYLDQKDRTRDPEDFLY